MIYACFGVVAVLLLLLFFQLRKIMSNQAQTLAILTAASATLTKIGEETKATLQKVQDLQDALNNAGNNTPEVDAALTALTTQLQVVDDLVPDPEETAANLQAAGGEVSESQN